jgi:hypothetical protein
MNVFRGGTSKAVKIAAITVLLGTVCEPALMSSQAKASSITDQIIQNVIQNILQDVRDQIQRRTMRPPLAPPNRALRFSGDDANSASSADDPFKALGYAKMPTKASPLQTAVAAPYFIVGFNVTGSGDSSRSTAGGVTINTSSFAATGAVDVTKIGIFTPSDALSVVFTGSGIWSRSTGVDSTTSVGAGTIAYVNGGFSTDFTVVGNWTRTSITGGTAPDSSGVSYSPNVQYKFDLANGWFIEPTIGVSFTETFADNFGTKTGDSTELHGGARIGTEIMWNGIRVQPSVSGAVFTIVHQSGAGATTGPGGAPLAGSGSTSQEGDVGGRGSGKLNFVWSNSFSSFIEVHGSGIANTTDIGGSGGLRWTF